MKKFFALMLSLCLMASMLCITVFAADDVVLRVSGQKEDGTLVEIKAFSAFDDGWDYAMEYAADHNWLNDNDYTRVVVDLLADWNAIDGDFTEDTWGGDKGFKWYTIRVYEEAIITLNLNGHTIDRGLTDNEYNGEVIYVDENSDFIINKGTITGGNSDNGAGGIHIKDGAKVTLNDVHIVNNITDGDDGGGLAMYDGATLVMNGGSFVGNINDSFDNKCGAAVYISDSTATFNNVRFYDNQFTLRTGYGAALYATNSLVTMMGCEIVSNGVWGVVENGDGSGSYSTIEATDNTVISINNTIFKENGSSKYNDDVAYTLSLIEVNDSSQLSLNGCTITENYSTYYILDASFVDIYVTNTTITDNAGSVFSGRNADFAQCIFNNNAHGPTFKINSTDQSVVFTDCDLGDSSFNNKSYAKFVNTGATYKFASIFSEGSLTMIIAILALVASVASIFLTVNYNKKKAVPAAASSAPENKE